MVSLETLRAFIQAAEANPVASAPGLALPNPSTALAGRISLIERYLHVLQLILCARILDTHKEPSFEAQQKVVQLAVHRIMVEENQVHSEHVVPRGPVQLQQEHHAREALRRYGHEGPVRVHVSRPGGSGARPLPSVG